MEPNDDEFKKILEKINQDKEDRHKGLEELLKRKKEIEKKGLIDHNSNYRLKEDISPKVRQTLSKDRKEINKKVYEHLQSPSSKEPKQLRVKHLNRFEEREVELENQARSNQVNRLKMIDKRTRYANIVKEIFAPTVDPLKRQEIEERIGRTTTKTRSAYNSRGNSIEPAQESLAPTYSQSNLKITNPLLNAGKTSLESPRNYS